MLDRPKFLTKWATGGPTNIVTFAISCQIAGIQEQTLSTNNILELHHAEEKQR